MTCTWNVADAATATGPESFVPYGSFAEALQAGSGFTRPVLVWGSVDAYWNDDGSAAFVVVAFSALPQELWVWVIGIIGDSQADSGTGFTAAVDALAAAQQSAFLPEGFCTESSMNCDPATLARAAACYACLTKDQTRKIWIYLLCQWAGFACGQPTETIRTTGAGFAGFNQDWEQTAPTQWRGKTDPTSSMELTGGQWEMTSIDTSDVNIASTAEFPCTWHVSVGDGPAPSGQYV